jgi:hypothetical protein
MVCGVCGVGSCVDRAERPATPPAAAVAAARESAPSEPDPAKLLRPQPAAPPAPAPPGVETAAARDFTGATLPAAELLELLGSARVARLHPVGSTSTVFKATLQAPISAALKAATRKRPDGPRAELAAYRLARLLGLRNVPPVAARRVPLAELRARFDGALSSWTEIEAQLVVDRDRRVFCAAIYWVDGLVDLGLEEATLEASVARYLLLATPLVEAERAFAAQLSTLLVFDYLIGNWDRWSGSNLKGDATGELLFMRDHDAAFARRLREPLQRRMLEPVVRSQRFSRQLYRLLRALTREALVRELASAVDASQAPLLDERALDGVFDRRAAILSHLDATLEEHGAAQVLVFP